MSVVLWGVRFRCDLCGADGDMPGRVPADKPVVYDHLACPEGWANLSMMSIRAVDAFGMALSHLCPDCAALNVGQLAARINARMQQERDRNAAV